MIGLRNLSPELAAMVLRGRDSALGYDFWLTTKDSNAYAFLRDKLRVHPSMIFFSLDNALGACTNNQNDRILVTPSYTETITGVGGITFDKAGIKLEGLGGYYNQPAFLMDAAATVSCLVTAADVFLQNLSIKAGHADINYFAHITGKGCILDHIRFLENVATENFVDIIHAGTADNDHDGLWINGCEFIMNDAACVTAIDLLKNNADVKITGNKIIGDFDASPYAPIYMASTEVPTNIFVADNFIHNQHDGNAALCISIACTTGTGWVIRNHAGHKLAAGETPFLGGAAGLYFGENYAAGVMGTASGYLYPAADS